MDDEAVAFADLDRSRLDHLRRDDGPVVHVPRYVDHRAGADQEIQRVGHGAVDVGPDVQRGIDALRDDHFCLQVLRKYIWLPA